jgi:hypothetical protein
LPDEVRVVEEKEEEEKENETEAGTEKNKGAREEELETPAMSLASTTSLAFIVDGVRVESPFDHVMVDIRDSLFMHLFFPTSPKDAFPVGVESAGEVGEKVGSAVDHLLKGDEKEKDELRSLNPHSIVLTPRDTLTIVTKNSESSSTGSEEDDDDSDAMQMKKKQKITEDDKLKYMAPEVITNEYKKGDEETCVYALGMLMWLVAVGKHPFDGCPANEMIKKILNGERPKLDYWPEKDNIGELIASCWCEDREKRIPLSKMISEARFFKEGDDLSGDSDDDEDDEDDEDDKMKDDKNDDVGKVLRLYFQNRFY